MKTSLRKTTDRGSRADAGITGVSASIMKKRTTHTKHRSSVGPSSLVSQLKQSIIGCRIRHGWKEVQRERGEVVDFLVGKRVECARQDGSGRKGMIIHQVK
uniref:Uncharacterized protein n=1 Tax=Capra hircus TaxID=9925 RepID=A0A8C2R6Q5_CAPHI